MLADEADGELMIDLESEVQRRSAFGVTKLKVRSVRQDHPSHVRGQRPSRLRGSVALNIDRVVQQGEPAVAICLINFNAFSQHQGEGLYKLVLDRLVSR